MISVAVFVILFLVLGLGLFWFGGTVDAQTRDLACDCGRRELRAVVTDDAARVREHLSAACPWCLAADQSRAVDQSRAADQSRAREEAVAVSSSTPKGGVLDVRG